MGGSTLEILGSYPVYIVHNDQLIQDEVYFAKGVKNIYLSMDSCKGISLIHKNFPNVDVASESSKMDINSNSVKCEERYKLTTNMTSSAKHDPGQFFVNLYINL